MLDLAARIAAQGDSGTVQAGFAFLTVGIGLKLAMFPLHLWLPNAYSYAPSAVTVLLAATATKVAVYMFLRFAFTVFGAPFAFADMQVGLVLMPLAIIAMFVASLVAIFQDDVKRMFAYSSVAQIGYMMLGISFATTLGLTGGIVHLFNHALMKGAMFMCLGAVFLRHGSVHIDTLQGLGRKMPVTFAALVIAGLSLIGIPGTVGFISKLYLVRAALDVGWWPVAVSRPAEFAAGGYLCVAGCGNRLYAATLDRSRREGRSAVAAPCPHRSACRHVYLLRPRC